MKQFLLHILAWLARFFIRRPAAAPTRLLLIKPDHLGDLLLATPALRTLRHSLPDAQITALVGPWARTIWTHNPDIDILLDLPFPGFERGSAGVRRSAAALLRPYLLLFKYAMLLRRYRYDVALILRDDHWWGAALALLAGIPRRIGYAYPLCAPCLSEALSYDPREHVSRQSLALVAQLTSANQPAVFDARLRFEPTDEDRVWAREWLERHLASGERLIVLHPGTGGPTKHWLPTRWAAVADQLASRQGSRLLLTGGPGEHDLVDMIAARMQHPVLRLVGQTSIGRLAALLGHAALVLGVDSGPLHIAVSQGTPTIHLFGPSDAGRFGPWGDSDRHIVLRADLFCSPCNIFSACPRATDPPECMALIATDTVLAAAQRLIHP